MKKVILSLILIFMLTPEFTEAQDWANLKYYQKENNSLKTPIPNENRVVFMGNSITEGWSGHLPDFFKNKPYINRGIGGQTTPQMLIRFKQDVVDLNPKVVVICAGTNDIAGNTGPSTLKMIVDNISAMAEIALANNIKVVIASVHPAYDYPWKPGLNPNEKIPSLNKLLKSYSEKNNIIYLDYFSAMVDDKNGLLRDLVSYGVHLNKKGYQIMGPLAEAAIKKALSIK
jgi:lysophospholipase L1-like esterase